MIWSYKQQVPRHTPMLSEGSGSPDQHATGFYDYAHATIYLAWQLVQSNKMFVPRTNAHMLQDPGLNEPMQPL